MPRILIHEGFVTRDLTEIMGRVQKFSEKLREDIEHKFQEIATHVESVSAQDIEKERQDITERKKRNAIVFEDGGKTLEQYRLAAAR
jgi:hypothetical protein